MTCEAVDPEKALGVLKTLATAPETRAAHAGIESWIYLLRTNREFYETIAARMERAYGAPPEIKDEEKP